MTKRYFLFIASATIANSNTSRDKSPDLYVEMKLEGKVWRTRVVERNKISWNQECKLIGCPTSTLCLSIKCKNSEDPYLGSVDITLNTLLSLCTNDAIATLEVKSNSLSIGFISVALVADPENSNPIEVVQATALGHPKMAGRLSTLAISQQCHFERFGQLTALENSISNFQKAIQLTDNGHPHKASYILNLGNSQTMRFECLGELSDLESSISNFQQAVELFSGSNKGLCLSNLGHSQQRRFEHLGELGDLESSISNLKEAIKLSSEGDSAIAGIFSNLGNGQHRRFERLGELVDLESSVANKRKAVKLLEDGHPDRAKCLSNLGGIQGLRFECLGELADLENSVSNLQEAVSLTDDEHPDRPMYLSNLGKAQQRRFERLGELVDLEDSILNKQKALKLTDDGHPDKPMYLSNLGNSLRLRFERLGEQVDLESSISNEQEAVKLTDNRHTERPIYLSNLGSSQRLRFDRLGEKIDLENSILNLQEAVSLTDDKHIERAMYLSNLGNTEQLRFECFGELLDLEHSILNKRKAVELTDDENPDKVLYLSNLGNSLQLRFDRLGKLSDLMASVSAYKAAAQSKTAYPRQALFAARRWADLAHRNNDLLSALDGYRIALGILPKVAWLGLGLTSRQDSLSEEKAERLGCLSASCAIQLGRLEEAVELLDLARSVFWQQASSLRKDSGALREEEPELADELESIGRKLDAGNFSDPTWIVQEQSKRREDAGQERRRLVNVWEGLVERVRLFPRFKYFLKPIPFRQLRQAATSGRVIIINISDHRVDAMIFGATGSIEHVPLSKISPKTLVELTSNVMLNRSADARASRRRDLAGSNLRNILRMVWHMILIPVFDKIGIPLESRMGLPQHRIWWYPTGPLTFIPIHAAGPDEGSIDVSRMIISSYVTTLDTLFQAQMIKMPVSTGQLKLLAISQPETPGQSRLPQSTTEALGVVQAACSAGWSKENIVHLHGPDATVDRASDALDLCSWAHFACHGSQDPVMGTKSAFVLHDGCLELGQIASKRLSNGQFAFLSACHAASGLKQLPGEAMHLAAGLQFAGFQSVIATMWGIRDEDAPKVADHTYQYLFRNGSKALAPSDAATALNLAIICLRKDPEMTLDRWAPFVHFGI